ncbi:MAG: IS4 family transposase, partial [Synergistaceae bacterium]
TLRGEMGGIPVKMFFVRYGKQDKWRLLITTDLALSFVKAFEIYQIRWTTEVLYKECRQYLRFGEYQGTDFDGMIADVTLTFLTHTMLTLEKRFQSYETFGEVFRAAQISSLENLLWQRILPMVYRLIELLSDITGLGVNEIMEMILQDEEKDKIYAELCNFIEKQKVA